jgi:Rrf2 family protein
MKMITKNSDYAIRAVIYLARHRDRYVPSSEISQKEKIPLIFLRRLLQELIKNKIAGSKEGAAGGVKLKAEPDKINIAQLIKIIQGNIQIIDCMFQKEICQNRATCVIRKKILGIEKKVVDELSKLTIQDLLDEKDK